MGPRGGQYTSLTELEKLPRDDISNTGTAVYTILGQRFKFGDYEVPADQTDVHFAVKFLKIATDLLERGKIQVHRPDVRVGGLEAVLQGLQQVREKKVSGVKLVYCI